MAKRTYTRHGSTELQNAVDKVERLGKRGLALLDRRTTLGRALNDWRNALIACLGGPEMITVQEECIVDLAVRTKLILDSIDAWILEQKSLINKKTRSIVPAVKERTTIANSLSQYLNLLGLSRREKSYLDVLRSSVEETKRSGEGNNDGADGADP